MLKVLDLFAGIGGFSLGLERTGGFRTVAFCEINKSAQRVLKKHWPSTPVYDDICGLSMKDLDEPVDVITGGFPCQDISYAGRGAGLDGERSGLWYEYLRLIKEGRPKWVIAENVSALRGRGLDRVLRSLAEIGYDAEWHCIPACYVGAWHKRDRCWILAYPHGQCGREGGTPQPVLGQSDLSRPLERGFAEWPGRSDLPTPNLCRTTDGVPARVDRTRQLGNSVVPQIPELIGHAILNRQGTTHEECLLRNP